MKVLVVGALPPPRSGRSAGLLEAVMALELGGHEVLRLPDGRRGTARLSAALLRRSRSADALVLQIEPALGLAVGGGRVRRAVQLRALSLALAAWGDVELRIDSFDDLPGGVGGRAAGWLWRRAARVIVRSEEQADELRRAAGIAAGSVEVDEPVAGELESFADRFSGAEVSREVSREAVQALVGRRAAAERLRVERRPRDAAARLLQGAAQPNHPPYGPLEPVVRYVYEHQALREPVRRLLRVVRRRKD